MIKTDSVPGSQVHGYLFTGGALLWDASQHVFEWRGGTLAFLSTAVQQGAGDLVYVNGSWAAWRAAETNAGVRRDLAAGSSVPVPDAWAVAAGGQVAYGQTGSVVIWNNGATTTLPSHAGQSIFGYYNRMFTDGTAVAYQLESFPMTAAYVTTPSAHDLLAAANELHSGYLDVAFSNGWSAWDDRTVPGPDSLGRRTPAGVRQPLSGNLGARLAALSPAGTVAYTVSGQYYLVQANGVVSGVGAVGTGETVIWRGTRFVLISGGSAYALAP